MDDYLYNVIINLRGFADWIDRWPNRPHMPKLDALLLRTAATRLERSEDLLEALEDAEQVLDIIANGGDAKESALHSLEHARAAIAKATGETER